MSEYLVIPENQVLSVKGTGIPKMAEDQNTDLILPGQFLTEITFAKMGELVFNNERELYKADGKVHPFDDPKYDGGSILIAGKNFGSGSSREHAPQGIKRYDINAIVAATYAGIFDGNCASIGLVAVTMGTSDIEDLVSCVEKNPTTEINIDLENQVITYDDRRRVIHMEEGVRQSFLHGTWDAMDVLRQNEIKIKQVEKKLPYLGFK